MQDNKVKHHYHHHIYFRLPERPQKPIELAIISKLIKEDNKSKRIKKKQKFYSPKDKEAYMEFPLCDIFSIQRYAENILYCSAANICILV